MSKSVLLFFCLWVFIASGKVLAQNPAGPWSLEACISYAITNNPEIKQSQLDLEANKATSAQSKAALLPTGRVGASHGYNFGRSINPFTNQFVEEQIQTSNFGLNGGLTLFNGFQLQNLIRQANLEVKAGQQGLAQTTNTIALQVALAYLAVLQNEELLVISKNQLATSQAQIARGEKLLAAGAMAPATLADLQVQAGNDELDLVNATNNLRTSKLTLMQLMNLPATTNFQVEPVQVEALVMRSYDKLAPEIFAVAEKVQPSIIGADLRVRSAQRGVQAVRGAFFPTLSLFGYVGSAYSSAAPKSRFLADGTGFSTREVVSETEFVEVNGARKYITTTQQVPNGQLQDFYYFDQLEFNLNKVVGLNLSFPILNGWQVRNRISNAVIARKRAELQANTARITLRQNIEQAYTELIAAQDRLETSRKQAEATQVAYTAAQKRFDNGSVHFVDLNLAKTNFDRAQSNLVRTKYEYIFRKKILDFYQDKPLTLLE